MLASRCIYGEFAVEGAEVRISAPSLSTKNAGSMVSICVCVVVSNGAPMASTHGPRGLDLATPMENGRSPAAFFVSLTGT